MSLFVRPTRREDRFLVCVEKYACVYFLKSSTCCYNKILKFIVIACSFSTSCMYRMRVCSNCSTILKTTFSDYSNPDCVGLKRETYFISLQLVSFFFVCFMLDLAQICYLAWPIIVSGGVKTLKNH